MIPLTPTAPIAFPVTCFANTGLLRPGTSRPVCTEKSRGAITNFWIFQLLFWQTFLSVSLLWMGSGSLASQALTRTMREAIALVSFNTPTSEPADCRLKPVRVLPTQRWRQPALPPSGVSELVSSMAFSMYFCHAGSYRQGTVHFANSQRQ